MNVMKKFSICLLSLFAMIMFVCCAPANKESYMERYRDFIEEVAENHQTYSAAQWEKAAEKYRDFSEKWYAKFERQLSAKEKVLVAGYSAKYNYYYARSQSKDVMDGIMELIDGEDVQQLIDGIKKEGSNAINQLEEFFNSL